MGNKEADQKLLQQLISKELDKRQTAPEKPQKQQKKSKPKKK